MVEIFLCLWFSCHLHFPVFHQLPHIRPQELERPCFCYTLLGIFTLHGFGHHASHRYCWIPILVLVCALPLLLGEAGLKLFIATTRFLPDLVEVSFLVEDGCLVCSFNICYPFQVLLCVLGNLIKICNNKLLHDFLITTWGIPASFYIVYFQPCISRAYFPSFFSSS